MKILLADDDPISRTAVGATLREWGFDILSFEDGTSAWSAMQQPNAPRLALLDWLMPGMDGLEICRRLRNAPEFAGTYVILLTSRDTKSDLLAGLAAGADDYIAKPFDREELRLRLRSGQRILRLQANLAQRVAQLEDALAQVKVLRGIIPICSYCKKIRDDQDYWQQVEAYIATQTELRFSHGICPDCYETRVIPELQQQRTPQSETPKKGGSSRFDDVDNDAGDVVF